MRRYWVWKTKKQTRTLFATCVEPGLINLWSYNNIELFLYPLPFSLKFTHIDPTILLGEFCGSPASFPPFFSLFLLLFHFSLPSTSKHIPTATKRSSRWITSPTTPPIPVLKIIPRSLNWFSSFDADVNSSTNQPIISDSLKRPLYQIICCMHARSGMFTPTLIVWIYAVDATCRMIGEDASLLNLFSPYFI